MKNALELSRLAVAGRPPTELECIESGEVASSTRWAEIYAAEFGAQPMNVRDRLTAAARSGKTYRGLHWRVVNKVCAAQCILADGHTGECHCG